MSDSTAINQNLEAGASDASQNRVSATGHSEENSLTDKPILFFDGVCGLCNSSVNFVLVRDKNSELYFSPLQGETAKQLLSAEDLAHIDTVIFRPVEGKQLYRRSAAVVRLLWMLSFPWNFLGWVLWCVPLPIRDLGYRIIVRFRYRLFGKYETCRLPTSEERAHFLP